MNSFNFYAYYASKRFDYKLNLCALIHVKLFISSWLKNTFDTNAVFTQKYLRFFNDFSQQLIEINVINWMYLALYIRLAFFFIQPGNLNIFMVVPEINRSKYGYILNILKNIASSLFICTFLNDLGNAQGLCPTSHYQNVFFSHTKHK